MEGKAILISDIAQHLYENKKIKGKPLLANKEDIKRFQAVIRMYIEIMVENILRGRRWKIEENFGEMYLEENETNYDKLHVNPIYSGKLVLNRKPFNPKTPDRTFKVKLISKSLKRLGVRFEKAPWIGSQIWTAMTEKNYGSKYKYETNRKNVA